MSIKSVSIKADPIASWERFQKDYYFATGELSNYYHYIRAQGGYWSCRFTLHGDINELRLFFETGLGRDIQTAGSRGITIWEGFVNSVRLVSTKRQQGLEVGGLGYIHKLDRRVYNQTASSGTAAISTLVGDVLDSTGAYVASRSIATNSTTMNEKYDGDRIALSILDDLAAFGDSSFNRYLIYMLNDRRFFYQPMSTEIKYYLADIFGDTEFSAMKSLTNMGNKIQMRYTTGTGTDRSTAYSDTESQKRYGIQEIILGGGTLPSSTQANQAVQTYLATKALPLPEIDVDSGNIYSIGGDLIPLEEIAANRWMSVQGLIPPTVKSHSSLLEDPSAVFIEEVEYNSDRDSVRIRSSKETILESLFAKLGARTV